MSTGLRMKNGAENSTSPLAFLGALSRFTITAFSGIARIDLHHDHPV